MQECKASFAAANASWGVVPVCDIFIGVYGFGGVGSYVNGSAFSIVASTNATQAGGVMLSNGQPQVSPCLFECLSGWR